MGSISLFRFVAEWTYTTMPWPCFDNRRYLIPGRLRDRVPALERADLRRINRDLLRVVHESRPDVFVETGGHRILP